MKYSFKKPLSSRNSVGWTLRMAYKQRATKKITQNKFYSNESIDINIKQKYKVIFGIVKRGGLFLDTLPWRREGKQQLNKEPMVEANKPASDYKLYYLQGLRLCFFFQ